MSNHSRAAALCISVLFVALTSYAQNLIQYQGMVRDSLSHEPISYALVKISGSSYGVLTDDNGRFKISSRQNRPTLVVTAMGFGDKSIRPSGKNNIVVNMLPIGKALGEVTVRPKKEKYSKKNNPAVDFVNKIRNSRELTDPRRNEFYNYDKYERITLALNNMNPASDKNLILKQFEFMRDYIDTSEVSGRPILNISNREKASTIHYRRSPKMEREHIDGLNQSGIDDFLDKDNMRALFDNFLGDIDLYKNDINLLHNRFVSPLSRIAPDFYKFYLTDTIDVSGERCIELSFVPHNSQSFGFTGKVYVPLGDTTMFIKKVEMNVPKDINLNFIDRMFINQEFCKAPDGSRLLVRDDIIAEIDILPGAQGAYIRRNTAYANHNFIRPEDENIWIGSNDTFRYIDVENRDEEFWQNRRLIPISEKEHKVKDLTQTLRQKPFYYWSEKLMKILANGYILLGEKSKFDIGPVNTVASSNTLEGLRLRLGGMTTANLNPNLFARGYAAYGFKDHKWKYSAEVEYSFTKKIYHPREYPVHSIRASHTYDVDMIGQHYAFANADNMLLSLKRMSDYQITYHRVSNLIYTLDMSNHLSITGGFKLERQEATPHMQFITGYGRSYSHFNEASFSVQLRYAPGEKIYNTKTTPRTLNPEIPIFILTHTYAPKGFLGSLFEVNKTEFSVRKQFWLSAFGYITALVKAGHIWSSCAYTDLLIPNSNLSYTIQPESFSLMNPMEFITDSYVSWDMAYWANGALFNYIPYFKKLKLREVFSFKGVWGRLSERNDPASNEFVFRFPEMAKARHMTSMPYMEASVGIDNIFKILRVDYVWRLTYRNYPDIDKGGVRFSLHLTF